MSSEPSCIPAALWLLPIRHPDLRSTSLALAEILIPIVMSKITEASYASVLLGKSVSLCWCSQVDSVCLVGGLLEGRIGACQDRGLSPFLIPSVRPGDRPRSQPWERLPSRPVGPHPSQHSENPSLAPFTFSRTTISGEDVGSQVPGLLPRPGSAQERMWHLSIRVVQLPRDKRPHWRRSSGPLMRGLTTGQSTDVWPKREMDFFWVYYYIYSNSWLTLSQNDTGHCLFLLDFKEPFSI